MSVYDIIKLLLDNWGKALGIVVVLSMIIQVTPIKINPWSAIGRQLKTFFLSDILQEIKEHSIPIITHLSKILTANFHGRQQLNTVRPPKAERTSLILLGIYGTLFLLILTYQR
jgi:hypothetical protein